jgi:type IV secretory pathway component VirB8
MNYHSNEEKTISMAIIAIVAALGVLGVVVITVAVTIPLQEAEAGCERGLAVNKSFERSSGRCFNPR